MITRVNDKTKLRTATIDTSGMAICPKCWHPLAEPLSGKGEVAIYCRKCNELRLVSFMKQ